MTLRSLLTMNAWLDNLNVIAPKDTLNSPRTQAGVIAGKPADAVDFCFCSPIRALRLRCSTRRSATTMPRRWTASAGWRNRLRRARSGRQAAGGEHLEVPPEAAQPGRLPVDHLHALQWARMQAAFPDGVCDWSRRGVGQQPAISPLTFSGSPGGVRLPPAPEAVAALEH